MASPPYFIFDFSRKVFLMLHSINWSNLIVWLPLLHEILDNMCIAILCFPDCDVINFEIKRSFQWSRFSAWPKSKDKNLNILRTKRDFKEKQKAFFILFNSFEAKKKKMPNWKILYKDFIKLSRVLTTTENRKSHITICLWNQHKIVYQKKL